MQTYAAVSKQSQGGREIILLPRQTKKYSQTIIAMAPKNTQVEDEDTAIIYFCGNDSYSLALKPEDTYIFFPPHLPNLFVGKNLPIEVAPSSPFQQSSLPGMVSKENIEILRHHYRGFRMPNNPRWQKSRITLTRDSPVTYRWQALLCLKANL